MPAFFRRLTNLAERLSVSILKIGRFVRRKLSRRKVGISRNESLSTLCRRRISAVGYKPRLCSRIFCTFRDRSKPGDSILPATIATLPHSSKCFYIGDDDNALSATCSSTANYMGGGSLCPIISSGYSSFSSMVGGENHKQQVLLTDDQSKGCFSPCSTATKISARSGCVRGRYNSNYGDSAEIICPMSYTEVLTYKERRRFCCRKSECILLKERYPNKIPLIIERFRREITLPSLHKCQYVVPLSTTVGQLQHLVRDMLSLRNRDNVSMSAIIFLIGEDIPSLSTNLSDLMTSYSDEDGFLYVNYTTEECQG